MNKFGEFLQKKRKETGLSLRDFSKLCGISHSYLDSLEKGKDPRTEKSVSPTIETLAKLSKGLKVPINELTDLAIQSETQPPLDITAHADQIMQDLVVNASQEGERAVEPPDPKLEAMIRRVVVKILEEKEGKK